MIVSERLTRQNRGGEETIGLHAVSVCLANAVHWIDGSSDWCGFGCRLLAVNQDHIRTYIRTYISEPSAQSIFNILINPDFENFDSALKEALSVFSVTHIAKASSYYSIVETRFIGLTFQFLVRV